MNRKAGRGGRRQRRFAKTDSLGPIDRDAISALLLKLAPTASDEQRALALTIVFKGIERFRERAPTSRALTGAAKDSRRALEKFKKGRTGPASAPFNGMIKFGGKVYATSSSGLYELEDSFFASQVDDYEGLDEAVANPLRLASVIQQLAAGIQNPNPNIAFDPGGMAEGLLDAIVDPPDHEAELAGYVYVAIERGLSIKPAIGWYTDEAPQKMRAGWNVGRLLQLAATEAGAVLPAGRDGMEGLMKRGVACAQEMLGPAITYSDGRSISYFEEEFPTE